MDTPDSYARAANEHILRARQADYADDCAMEVGLAQADATLTVAAAIEMLRMLLDDRLSAMGGDLTRR